MYNARIGKQNPNAIFAQWQWKNKRNLNLNSIFRHPPHLSLSLAHSSSSIQFDMTFWELLSAVNQNPVPFYYVCTTIRRTHPYASSLLIYLSTWKSTTMVNFFHRINSREWCTHARTRKTRRKLKWRGPNHGWLHTLHKSCYAELLLHSLIPYYGELNEKENNSSNNSTNNTRTHWKGEERKANQIRYEFHKQIW